MSGENDKRLIQPLLAAHKNYHSMKYLFYSVRIYQYIIIESIISIIIYRLDHINITVSIRLYRYVNIDIPIPLFWLVQLKNNS